MESVEKKIYIEKIGDGVANIVLNKPKKKNALDLGMMDELRDCILEVGKDEEIKVVILKGEGHCFCAGGDLSGSANSPKNVEFFKENAYRFAQAADAILKSNKHFIAMVEGYAIGGGASLALVCDQVFMSENAKVLFNFLNLGITPEMGAFITVARDCGLHRAKDIFYSGKKLTAEEMYNYGIVTHVCSEDTIEADTVAYAKKIAEYPTTPATTTKRILNALFLPEYETLMALEPLNAAANSMSSECKEYQIKNFMKK